MASKIARTSTDQAITTMDSDHTPSLSAQAVAENDDLLTEILLRLPTKSLLKFKSVSKHFHSLITSPAFYFLRTPFPHTTVGLFAIRAISLKLGSLVFISLIGDPQRPHISPLASLPFLNNKSCHITQSVNGLLLIRTPFGSFYRRVKNSEKDFYIANPTTKQYHKLPRPAACSGSTENGFIFNLAFDPSKSMHYKVACVRSIGHPNQQCYQIEIYSSETRCWKLTEGGPFEAPFNIGPSDHGDSGGGVYWNGAVHWISKRHSLLYFNLDEERVLEKPLPANHERSLVVYFGESRDHMHLIEMLEMKTQFDVYEMERDYSNWSVKFRVDLDNVSVVYPQRYITATYFSFTVMSIVRCEVDEESYMVLYIKNKVILYNLKTSTFKKHFDSAVMSYGSNSHQYIESFASI